jgi:hypothetical protein
VRDHADVVRDRADVVVEAAEPPHDRARVDTAPASPTVTPTSTSPTASMPLAAAPLVGERGDTAVLAAALNLSSDRVRWGPIVAGVFTSTTTLLLLGLLGLTIGLATGLVGGGAADSFSAGSALFGGLALVGAFFAGGLVAGRAAAVFDRRWGALNGALVFFVGVPLLLWIGASSLGAVLGVIGSFTSALSLSPQQLSTLAEGATVLPTADAANTAETGGWIAMLGLLLALAAGAAGGALGTRRWPAPGR